jgi:Xaa-Pro dipeptidase
LVKLKISLETYKKRIEKVREELRKRSLDALLLMDPENIAYMSGFSHTSTERWISLTIPVEGDVWLLVPKLDEDSAKLRMTWIKDICVAYFDTPGVPHYLTDVAKAFKDRGLAGKKIGADRTGLTGARYGITATDVFRKELPGTKIVDIADMILNMRMIKDEEELNLMREAAKWGHLAISLVKQYVKPGLNPMEVVTKASLEATMAQWRALGPEYHPGVTEWGLAPALTVTASIQLQGTGMGLPHGPFPLPDPDRKLKLGEHIRVGGDTCIGGYSIEQSRDMFIGEPTEEQKKYFNIVLNARLAGFEAVKPGVRACDVERAVVKVFKDAGVMQYVKHHTGHGIPMHGFPWIDEGDETVLKPGMVFSIEPGLFWPPPVDIKYHSHETVAVTEDGAEWLSYYPRDQESAIIKA